MANAREMRAGSVNHFARKHGSDMLVVIADTPKGYKVFSAGSPSRKGEASELADRLTDLLDIEG